MDIAACRENKRKKQLREFSVQPTDYAKLPITDIDLDRFENIDEVNECLEDIAAEYQSQLPDLISELERALTEKIETFRDIAGSDFADLQAGLDKFFKCLHSGKSLMKSFKFLGMGTFKECYELTPRFIIKLCRPANPTLRESLIYDAAHTAGVDKVFAPTIYTPLFGCWIPLPYLTYYTPINSKKGEIFLASDIIIQYRVAPASNFDEDPFDYCTESGYAAAEQEINELKALYGKPAIKVKDVEDLGIDSPTFLEALCARYPNDFLEKLFDFLSRSNLFDLHSDNVGQVAAKGSDSPVPFIFDWMS